MVDRKKTGVTVKSVLSAWGHVCFSGSQLGAILSPRAHLAISGDIL